MRDRRHPLRRVRGSINRMQPRAGGGRKGAEAAAQRSRRPRANAWIRGCPGAAEGDVAGRISERPGS